MYIAVSDLKNRELDRLPADIKTRYVDDTNEFLVDYADTIGVEVGDIATPIKPQLRNWLVAHCQMEIAQAYIGSDGTANSGATGVYEAIYAINAEYYRLHKPSITENLLTQTKTGRTNSAVNFGTAVRR